MAEVKNSKKVAKLLSIAGCTKIFRQNSLPKLLRLTKMTSNRTQNAYNFRAIYELDAKEEYAQGSTFYLFDGTAKNIHNVIWINTA